MTLRPIPRTLALAVSAAALVLTSACGGGDGGGDGRPSADEIADALGSNDSGLSDDAIDCSAEALEGSDVSDEGLQAIIDDPDAANPPDLSAEDTQAFGAATSAILACAGDDLEEQLGDLPSDLPTDLGDLPTDLPSDLEEQLDDLPTDLPTG